jgi:adenylate cyclase class 1
MNDTSKINTFQLLNRKRIERLSSLLPARQQNFIHLLPLLFHVNSTSLPGYINLEAPAGIVDYQPDKQAVDAAKSYHRAFSYTRRALHRYPIHALYLINKHGLLSYNASQPFELWLIYAQPISEAQLTLLKQKSVAISKWSQAEGIPLTIQLYDEATLLIDGPAYYDLDLFYCSGILLAGKPPSWWMEKTKGDDQKQIPQYEKESIDFGPIQPLSDTERFDLTADNLEEAFDLGIESCLELLYFDSLLNLTHHDSLSLLLIHAIIDGETDPMLLDINHLKYTFITQHTSDLSALTLAQQSLYLKSKESLSKSSLSSPHPWRKDYIQQQIEEWQWPDTQSEQLDLIPLNHYRQSLPLFQLFRAQLSASLAKLAAFSQQHKIECSQRSKQLQQKFDALFNEQGDTLTQLPSAFFPRQAEEYAYLYRKKNTQMWCIDDRELSLSKIPIYQHSSLLNVLAWAINNHLISKVTRLKVADESHSVQTNVIIELVQYLLRTPLGDKPVSSEENQFDTIAQLKHVLLFANIDCQINDSLSQHGFEISSSQDDPFNYANKKQNLVSSIEGLVHSDWGQWHYFSFSGNECLLQMLTAILHWHPADTSISSTSCWCHYGNHGQNISHRIEKSYHHVLSHYIKYPEIGEYIVSIGENLYRLIWQNGLCDYTRLAKKETVQQYLAKPRPEFTPTTIDPMLDDDGLLNTILSYQIPDHVNLFILTIDSQLIVYILDDMGSLFTQQFENLTQDTLTQHFNEFLSAIPNDGDTIPVHFFHVSKQYKPAYKITELSLKKNSATHHHLPVTIEMDSTDENTHCTIFCGTQSFSGIANKLSLFSQVRDLLLSLRKSNSHYHLYVTRLIFKQQNVPIRDYLLQKQRLEYLLNKL